MYSIVNQGAKRDYSWATRPMSNEEWRWEAPDLSVSYNCPSILNSFNREDIKRNLPIGITKTTLNTKNDNENNIPVLPTRSL